MTRRPKPFVKDNNGKKARQEERRLKQIGDRDVGKGINWISIEKEIGMGKQLRTGNRASGEDC